MEKRFRRRFGRPPFMDGFLNAENVKEVRGVLVDHTLRDEIVTHNYAVGRKFFSYERVEMELRPILDRLRL